MSAPFKTAFKEFHASGKGGSDMTKPFTSLLNMDLVETDKEYKIVGDIPGVDPDHIELSLDERSLYIVAKREEDYESHGNKVHLIERPFGEVNRRIDLPKNAELDKANSCYKNGVLVITFPKIAGEGHSEHKKLSISSA